MTTCLGSASTNNWNADGPGVAEPVPYQPDRILEVLERHQVRYVVIGGLAAEIHGSPYITRNVDVTPARNRIEPLD